MRSYENIIIGFGKGGKTLAAALAQAGQKTALIERDPAMYGGTCINVACIPSKSLEHSARLSAAQGGDYLDQAARYRAAVSDKNRLTTMLREKNRDKLIFSGVELLTGEASFVDPQHITLRYADGAQETIAGERFFLNTGARPFLPPIEGLKGSRHVYTSETLMALATLPRRLLIIGGGYIGLEFASYYANFGSKATVVQDGEAFIPREDAELSQAVLESLNARGIRVLRGVAVQSIRDTAQGAVVMMEHDGAVQAVEADAVLIATGRRPDLTALNLAAAGVELTARGGVKTDVHLRTTAPHIFAMGDLAGGLQFTYISLDDSRIVLSALLSDGSRTVENRGAVPYTVFLDPPLSRVGLSEAEAVARGLRIQTVRMEARAIPKAQVLKRPTGLLKMIINAENGEILGAHFFCAESQEMINLIKLCMDAHLPYTVLRDGIFNHPTMSEALNDLLGGI